MSAPLTIKFATDTSAAKSGMQDLAASVLSNMVKVSDSLNTGIKANGGYAATVKTLATNVGSDFMSVANAGLKAANDTNLSGVAIGAAVGKAAAETKTASVVMKGGYAVAAAQAQFAYGVIRNEAAATAGLIARSPLVLGGIVGITAAAATFMFVKDAVAQANAQIERFIKLGDNASQAGVSVDFWQRFSEAATKAKMDVEAVEQALKNASTVVTPKFEQEDPIKARLNELFESGYLGSYKSKGLADYNSASSNEQRIRAAVTAMQELRDLGVQLAAIDLAEKLFGAETAARIRSGKLDLDQIAKSLDAPREDLVKQEEVERAQEFRERLDAAYKTIDDFLHVSVALEGSGRAVLDVWLMIAEAVAKSTANAGDLYTKLQKLQNDFSGGFLGDYFSKVGQVVGGTAKIIADGLSDQANGTRTIYDRAIGPGLPGMPGQPPAAPENRIVNPPAPPRRPLSDYLDRAKATPSSGGAKGDSFDAVETFINGLEKSAAAAKAEAEAFGKGNAAKAEAIALAKLKETADQQGITVTDEQIAKVKAATAASSKYRDQIADLEQAQQQAAETARYFGNAISNSFADAILEGKSFANVLQDLEKMIARAALQALFTGQGPMAGILGLAPAASSGSNAVGGIAGMFSSMFGGARANGGAVQAGRAYKVGEMGEEMFFPDQDGRIVPISRGGGFGGAGGAPINVYNYAGEAVSATPQRRNDGGIDVLIDRIDSGLAQRVGGGRGDLAALSPGARNLRG